MPAFYMGDMGNMGVGKGMFKSRRVQAAIRLAPWAVLSGIPEG